MRVELMWSLHQFQNKWWAQDLSGQIAYQLSDSLAGSLMAPLSQRPLTPLVPASVIGISYRDRSQQWSLRQYQGTWQVMHLGAWHNADQQAVTQYLQYLLSWQMSPQQDLQDKPAFAYQPASRGQNESWINDAQAEIELLSGNEEELDRYRFILGPRSDQLSVSLPTGTAIQLPSRITIDRSHRGAQRPSAYSYLWSKESQRRNSAGPKIDIVLF